MKNIRSLVMGIGLGVSALLSGCETPSPVEMAMFGPGGIERLSAQGYYQMANDPSLTRGQREGALVMGNILDNQANYQQGAAIAREGRSNIVINVQKQENQQTIDEESIGLDIPHELYLNEKYNGTFSHVEYENGTKFYVYKSPLGVEFTLPVKRMMEIIKQRPDQLPRGGIFDYVKYERGIKYYVYKYPSGGTMAYPEDCIKKYMQSRDEKDIRFNLESARLAE